MMHMANRLSRARELFCRVLAGLSGRTDLNALQTSRSLTLTWALVVSAPVLLGACSALPTMPAADQSGNPPAAAAEPATAHSGLLIASAQTAETADRAAQAPPSPAQEPGASQPSHSVTGQDKASPSPASRAAAVPAAAPLRTLPGAEQADPADRSDLWERVRRGFAMPGVESDLVRKWEQWYATRPDYVQRMTERGGRYLFHVVEEVQKRGMPTELALLPFIESAFNPQALSVASASGMWQFMPATGRQYELKQNLFRDDRRDVLASTRAALDYLQMLYLMFDDWHLALAAYNWGQGNVQRALERNRRARLEPTYTALRMPDETRNYLPKLQAVKNILLAPDAFGLTLPVLENHPFFLTVTIERDIDASLVAGLAGLPMEEFQALNPQLNKPVLLAAGTPQVLLPYDNANRFIRELARHPGPWASWTAWVAPRTLSPAEAAKLIGLPESRLRELNRIPDRMLIKVGSALIVPRGSHHAHDVTEQVADQANMQLTPDATRLVRKTVKAHSKGESLVAFAQRNGIDLAELARWNKLSAQAVLRPGQAVTVMTAVQSAAGAPGQRKTALKRPTHQGKPAAKLSGKTAGKAADKAVKRLPQASPQR